MSQLEIAPLADTDRASWEALARAFRQFYRLPTSDADFDAAWQRIRAGTGVHALGAKLDGQLVGIAHYVLPSTTWAASVCYLQDLFTIPEARGKGVGRALIHAVADEARRQGARRYCWMAPEDDTLSRTLYNKVARKSGFVRYDFPL